ncbi:MAG: hypothetical protein U1E76_03675 [Planctomycetota bacterium]
MMLPVLTLLSFVLFAASCLLWLRLGLASARLEPCSPLRAVIAHAVDEQLLPDGRRAGLADMILPFREAHDRFAHVQELIDHLDGGALSASTADHEQILKHLYQLQAALSLSGAALDGLLAPVLASVARSSVMGQRVARVLTIAAGDLVDLRTMRPLNMGSRVKQPLGVVLLDKDGKVLSRAKVWCG